MRIPLSVLDLAPIARGETASSSIAASVALAQRAEEHGYRRVWYAEHHNMPGIASSATSVLIAHVGAQTGSIRLGAGGVMLPNHAPLTIAEQFGTLDAMYPGRIDLGLGRAPGSDQNTMYALRRDPMSADRFPQDVLELQAYLAGETRVPGVNAIPGKGSQRPALHPRLVDVRCHARRGPRPAVRVRLALRPADARARRRRLPPRVHALGAARRAVRHRRRERDRRRQPGRRGGAAPVQPAGPGDRSVRARPEAHRRAGRRSCSPRVPPCTSTRCSRTPRSAGRTRSGSTWTAFRKLADADELIVAHQSPTIEGRLRSVTLTAEAMEPAA